MCAQIYLLNRKPDVDFDQGIHSLLPQPRFCQWQ
jgi:hypothetical protein